MRKFGSNEHSRKNEREEIETGWTCQVNMNNDEIVKRTGEIRVKRKSRIS